ncbi:hypothetical protein [Cognatiyoonia sp. IB215182]|uniref:hypothetical protein n=1 Tax=Cognatiyoonia sp. IB215182 TaxID=3097353 RepID=UPI002A15CB42|nr:hypothetical protein [Cognatiyoonia sp. IB215182]MDX8353320.1 hypothetical protein [Cognatiyoonia sp. IB215182]
MTFTADFVPGGGVISGADNGRVVGSTLDNTDLNGSIMFDCVTAELDGAIGKDRVAGAFVGHDQNRVLVCGLAGKAK